MENLVLSAQGAQTMTSLEIATITNKLHKNVIRDIRNMETSYTEVYGTERKFEPSKYKDKTGRMLLMFNLTKSQALFVVSSYSATMRAKIQKRWEELETANLKSQPKLPTNFKEALYLLIEAEEVKEKLTLKISEDKPKVLLHDRLMDSDINITFDKFSKISKIGRNKLYAQCRVDKILMKNGVKKNLPYQNQIKNGNFTVIEKIGVNKYGLDVINYQTLITPKGQSYLTKKYLTK